MWWERHVKPNIKRLAKQVARERNTDHYLLENHPYECLYDILKANILEADKRLALQKYKAKILRLHAKKREKILLDTPLPISVTETVQASRHSSNNTNTRRRRHNAYNIPGNCCQLRETFSPEIRPHTSGPPCPKHCLATSSTNRPTEICSPPGKTNKDG